MYDRLISEAVEAGFAGWDFSWLEGRLVEAKTRWDYLAEVRAALEGATSLLDIGTGGGERLAQLGEYPPLTVATESYGPNVAVAARNLGSFGVPVVQTHEGIHNRYGPHHPEGLRAEGRMPFCDGCFDVIVSRHTSYCATEVFRLLRPGGRFVTQQVGGDNYPALREHLAGAAPNWDPKPGTPDPPTVRDAGFEVIEVDEDKPESVFRDIGAVVYYLKAVPWHIVDFDEASFDGRLRQLHEHIEREGGLVTHHHRYLIKAIKPA